MPRPRRAARSRRNPVTEGERLWALGELEREHPEYADVIYFTPPARLHEVWLEVRGTTLGAWMAQHAERWRHGGQALVYGAIVGFLEGGDVAALQAGVDPWGAGQGRVG